MSRKSLNIWLMILYAAFILVSLIVHFEPGRQVCAHFSSFFMEMLGIVPAAFILIGLFEVWVKRATIEKHLTGWAGMFWGILLAGTTVGGLYVAFPVAHALLKKGAQVRVVFAYLFAAAIFRVPMTLFEASFIGLKFTLIRLSASLPLILLGSVIMEKVAGDKLNSVILNDGKNLG